MATHDTKKSSGRENEEQVGRSVSSDVTKLANGQQQQQQSNNIVMVCPYCAKESFSSLEALSLHVQALHG